MCVCLLCVWFFCFALFHFLNPDLCEQNVFVKYCLSLHDKGEVVPIPSKALTPTSNLRKVAAAQKGRA